MSSMSTWSSAPSHLRPRLRVINWPLTCENVCGSGRRTDSVMASVGRLVGRIRAGLVWLLVLPIRLYQRVISPMTPASCRFHPSCSAYAVGALRRHGPAKGTVLAVYRVGRCHPWQPGGLDPVPPKGAWRPDITPDGRTVIPLEDLRRSPLSVPDELAA